MAYNNKLKDKIYKEEALNEDFSWDKMQGSIADRMEQKKRKPRLFFWLFFSAFIAALGIYLFTQNSNESSNPLTQKTARVMQENNINSGLDTNTFQTNQNITINENTTIKKESTSSNKGSADIQQSEEKDQKQNTVIENRKTDQESNKINTTEQHNRAVVQNNVIENKVNSISENNNEILTEDKAIKTIIEKAFQNNVEDSLNTVNITSNTENEIIKSKDTKIEKAEDKLNPLPLAKVEIETNEEIVEMKLKYLTRPIKIFKPQSDHFSEVAIYGGLLYRDYSLSEVIQSQVDNPYTLSDKALPGINFGILAKYNLHKNMYISSGVNFDKMYNKYTYKGEKNTEVLQTNVLKQIKLNLLGNQTENVYGDSLATTRISRSAIKRNEIFNIAIPLTLGYEMSVSQWRFGIDAGPMFSIYTKASGKIKYNDDLSVYEQKGIIKNTLGFGISGGMTTSYHITDKMYFGAKIGLSKYFNNYTITAGEIKLPLQYNAVIVAGYRL